VGTPWVEGAKLYNAYALLAGGVIEALRYKVDLPNYGVFDEKRVFAQGPMPGPILFKGIRVGIPICEDIWGAEVVECVSETGGEILLVPNGSPYWRGKTEHRLNIAVARVVESGLPLIYLNMNRRPGRTGVRRRVVRAQRRPERGRAAPTFAETVALTEWKREAGTGAASPVPRRAQDENDKTDYGACVLACATMSTRAASRASCWGSPAASTRRCAPRWRSMRWGQSVCAA